MFAWIKRRHKFTLSVYIVAMIATLFQDIVNLISQTKIDFIFFMKLSIFAVIIQAFFIFYRLFSSVVYDEKTEKINVVVLMIGSAGMIICFLFNIFPT